MKLEISKVYVKWLLVSIGVLSLLSFLSVFFLDHPAFNGMSRHPSSMVNNPFILALRQLGKAWVPIWLLLVWGWLKRDQRPVVVGLLGLILLAPSVALIKGVVQRPRPIHIINNQLNDNTKPSWRISWSFPSGDTATVFVVAATSCAFIRYLSVRMIIFLLVGTVGVLRVYSQHHYPSDVFAGAALGIGLGIASLYISRRLFDADPEQHPYFANDNALIFIAALPMIATVFETYNPLRIFLTVYGIPVLFAVIAVLLKQKRIPFVKTAK